MLQQLFTTRQSCRNYSTKPVEREKLLKVLEAGMIAPSSRNRQPWTFHVCGEKTLPKVKESCQLYGNAFLTNCPELIVVTMHPRVVVDTSDKPLLTVQDFRPFDIGLAVMQMCLQATELGLSTCMIGLLNQEMIQQAVGTEEEVKIVLALGYAADDDVIREKKRRTMDETVRFVD
jgi:nitroreductase